MLNKLNAKPEGMSDEAWRFFQEKIATLESATEGEKEEIPLIIKMITKREIQGEKITIGHLTSRRKGLVVFAPVKGNEMEKMFTFFPFMEGVVYRRGQKYELLSFYKNQVLSFGPSTKKEIPYNFCLHIFSVSPTCFPGRPTIIIDSFEILKGEWKKIKDWLEKHL